MKRVLRDIHNYASSGGQMRNEIYSHKSMGEKNCQFTAPNLSLKRLTPNKQGSRRNTGLRSRRKRRKNQYPLNEIK